MLCEMVIELLLLTRCLRIFFVMCMDKLSHLIMEAVQVGDWKPMKAGRSGPLISHLTFADDLLIFGEATIDQMKCHGMLDKFCHMSGQMLSAEKSCIFFPQRTLIKI